ncbi:MAG: RteC domain-containing protein [Bacteroides thetaiotaomicron]
MKQFSSEILKKIQKELALIDMEDCHISIEESADMTAFLNNCLTDLRAFFFSLESITQEDEILFFKEIKPEILGFLLYFNKIHTIELKCPNGSNDTLIEYYENEQKNLTFFFERNLDFYQYYRAKSTHLDNQYFLRKKIDNKVCLESVYFIMDNDFCTGYDYKVAKIICNEMLRIYLNKKVNSLEKQLFIDKKRATLPIGNLRWTGPLVALTEVGYGFDASEYVNNGKADIKEIMTGLEILFNVDLGKYYRAYTSMRNREEQTKYLKIIIERLKKRMDEDDSR